jgi:hypothetical protein
MVQTRRIHPNLVVAVPFEHQDEFLCGGEDEIYFSRTGPNRRGTAPPPARRHKRLGLRPLPVIVSEREFDFPLAHEHDLSPKDPRSIGIDLKSSGNTGSSRLYRRPG